MILKITKDLWNIDLSEQKKYTLWSDQFSIYFPMLPGQNHHCLLAYLSSQLPKGSVVGDFGTYLGHSALALSYNPDVRVITIDPFIHVAEDLKSFLMVQNIQFIKGICQNYLRVFENSPLVFLDIAPHDGVEEVNIMEGLDSIGFRGILILDDIYYNYQMEAMWNDIIRKKIDITKLGHHSGTGIVVFDPEYIDVQVED